MPRHLIVGTDQIAYPLGVRIVPPRHNWSEIRRLRCAMAYATHAGLSELLRTFNWLPTQQPPTPTLWVIGIHNGISEPGALSILLSWRNSRVRIFTADGHVNRRSMLLSPRMHAKIIALDPKVGSGLFAEVAGSGNLTSAAIGSLPSNFEAGIVLTSEETDLRQDRETFDRWWRQVWRQSINVTTSLIDSYARERGRFLREMRRVIDVVELDQPDTTQIAAARFLWIEAGDMSGGNEPAFRYQMEISESLAQFISCAPAGYASQVANADRRVGARNVDPAIRTSFCSPVAPGLASSPKIRT